jgi:hypothetical protein
VQQEREKQPIRLGEIEPSLEGASGRHRWMSGNHMFL